MIIKSFRSVLISLTFLLIIPLQNYAQMKIMGKDDDLKWEEECLKQSPQWYGTEEAVRIADIMLFYQNDNGGWPKNVNMTVPVTEPLKKRLTEDPEEFRSTIDNMATVTQARFLSRVYQHTKDSRYSESVIKAIDYLLEAQYPNGGWPQFFPVRKGYSSHITFNDDAMINVLNLFRDITKKREKFDFIDPERLSRVDAAMDTGIDCILKCQVVVDGKRTAWCAQHDENTFAPAKARSYELPSLSGKESVGIIEFLMGIDDPDETIIVAIRDAVAWLEKVKINGIRVIRKPDPAMEKGYDRVVVSDPKAPPMWARFYEIGTDRYFFCDRDGSVHYDLSEISAERRNDYGWLGDWPGSLLEKKYPKWEKKWILKKNGRSKL